LFIEKKGEDRLLGVVHFSEETMPRQYYHCLVELDSNNLRPTRISKPFCFLSVGVEFCIGFTMMEEQEKYVFWISQMDRDAAMIEVPMEYFSGDEQWINM
jgi:hypothetical protein